MSDHTSKNYPISTPEIAELMKIGKVSEEHAGPQPAGHFEASDLPVLEAQSPAHGHEKASSHSSGSDSHAAKPSLSIGNILKAAAPYALVFGVAIVSYYFFFSQFSLESIFRSNTPKVSQKEKLLTELKKDEAKNYQNWIQGFYFDVTDAKVVDPDTDNSGNGLTNFQKYLLSLNPKAYDSLGIGMPDSEALARGINPVTGSGLTQEQKDILEKYFDMETVMNRLTLAHMQKQGTVAGSVTDSGFVNSPSQQVDPNFVDIDTTVPGRLEVDSLGINVPIIWTEDTRNFDRDLQSGVVHYPGTALPGQMGTSYISGHSSNYIWAKGDYNQVFATLGNLPDNSSIKITVVQKNGRDAKFYYVVTHRKEYRPTEQEQFMSQGKSVVALSTCWPIGTTQKRLVVFADLVQVQKD